MAVKKNATEAAEMEGKEKTVNNTMKDGKTDSGANNEAAEGEKKEGETVTLAYIGPSLPAGLLKTNKILIGTREEIEQRACGSSGEVPACGENACPG